MVRARDGSAAWKTRAAWCTRLRRRDSPTRPTTKRRGRRIRPTRWRGSSSNLRIEPGKRVVDLAAGTGKLTRLLAPAGADLIAAEPVAGMRDDVPRRVPGVPMMATTAEQLAFRDASLDAVTVAQAFHWFDHDRAIAELARALRPGGRVGLVWNARDRSVDWVDQVWSIMDRVEKRAPWRNHDEWSDSAYTRPPRLRAAAHRAVPARAG